jgi:site-specific DNA-methyltransferase (adenine-specific)
MQLIHGDCLEKMKDIPDKSIDMILCDLPYGTTSCKWDKVIPFEPLWEHYNRIIKDRGAIVLFGSQPFTSFLVCSNSSQFKYSWKWNKIKPSMFLNAKNAPMKKIEDICVFSSGTTANKSTRRMPYFPQGIKLCGKVRPPKNGSLPTQSTIGNRPSRANAYFQEYTNYPCDLIEFTFERNPVHPTQKPVALLEYLIKTYTLENETVLDNAMGSGSTGIACINTKRNFIGIEKDEKYFEIAKNRIDSHVISTEPSKSVSKHRFVRFDDEVLGA